MTFNDFSYRVLPLLRIAFSSLLLFLMGHTVVLAQEIPESEPVQETISADNYADPYLVENIEADATADNAVMAREKAFEAAQIRGYEELAKRFLSEEELIDFEAPEIDEIADFVIDFEVTNEKLSLTRYKGTYNIRYASNIFQSSDESISPDLVNLPSAKALLVVPFLDINGRTYLWQINPFWEAWKRAQSRDQIGKIAVPLGTSDDVSSLRDGQGLRYEPAAINAMRIRYQTTNAALVVARPERVDDNRMKVMVFLYRTQAYGPELIKTLTVNGFPGEIENQLYNRVVRQVAQALHSDFDMMPTAPQTVQDGMLPAQPIAEAPRDNDNNAPRVSGPPNSLIAQLQFSNARQWVETKRAIESIRGVETLQIRSLSARSATIGINFLGSVDALRRALFQQGIRLNNAPTGGIYQLMPVNR